MQYIFIISEYITTYYLSYLTSLINGLLCITLINTVKKKKRIFLIMEEKYLHKLTIFEKMQLQDVY